MAVKKVSKRGTIAMTKNEKTTTRPEGPYVTGTGPFSEIRVGIGTTLNMGNYESLRLGVDVSVPCLPNTKDMDKAFARALTSAEQKLDMMIKSYKKPIAVPKQRTAQEVLSEDDDTVTDDEDEVDL